MSSENEASAIRIGLLAKTGADASANPILRISGSRRVASLILPLPDSTADDMANMRGAFRGRRGSTLVVEGVARATAAGMNPQLGQRSDQLSPDLSRSMTAETLAAARDAICGAFGVLPGLMNPATTGPMVREAQRHLAGWVLQPMAELLAEEASAKLGTAVMIDVGRPLQAFDAGGRARADGRGRCRRSSKRWAGQRNLG